MTPQGAPAIRGIEDRFSAEIAILNAEEALTLPRAVGVLLYTIESMQAADADSYSLHSVTLLKRTMRILERRWHENLRVTPLEQECWYGYQAAAEAVRGWLRTTLDRSPESAELLDVLHFELTLLSDS